MASKKAKKAMTTKNVKALSRFKNGEWVGPKLDELTPEQEALAERVAAEYIDDLTVSRAPDRKAIDRWLKIVYGIYEIPVPSRIEVVASPQAALLLATDLTGEAQTQIDWCGTGDGGWVSFYDLFHRIGVLSNDEAADTLALRDFGRVAWDTVLLDECAIVIQRPVSISVDENGNLHSTTGPCIRWADGEQDFAYHGTWLPERIVMSPRSFTRDEFRALTNTEERRALSEIAGWDWVTDLLGAKSDDAWTDPATGLEYTLMSYEYGKLLRKQSPPLKQGAQPTYIEPVNRDLRTARAARKWQATRLTPEQCEREPDLSYRVEA